MCLMLYVATRGDQPYLDTNLLNVDDVEPKRLAVRQWLTLPVVRHVGSHTGCGCGFRSIMAEAPVAYDDAMFDDETAPEDAATAKASLAALLTMVRGFAERDGAIELLAVWDGDESEPPLGTIDKGVDDLQPETWFFIERFRYCITVPSAR